MKLVIQRVSYGQVKVEEKIVGQIERGYVVLLGVGRGDTESEADRLVQKLLDLRIMADENEKMNLSVKDVEGALLVVPQFTLYANTSSRRPGFSRAASPEEARELYKYFINRLKESSLVVQTGEFGAKMLVTIKNDGPVTIILES